MHKKGTYGIVIGFAVTILNTSGIPMSSIMMALLPHGVVELPALFLVCAIGMYGISKESRRIASIPILMLFVSAGIESFITPLLMAFFRGRNTIVMQNNISNKKESLLGVLSRYISILSSEEGYTDSRLLTGAFLICIISIILSYFHIIQGFPIENGNINVGNILSIGKYAFFLILIFVVAGSSLAHVEKNQALFRNVILTIIIGTVLVWIGLIALFVGIAIVKPELLIL